MLQISINKIKINFYFKKYKYNAQDTWLAHLTY